MRQASFPDATLLRLPPGYLAQVHESARRQGQTSAEFLRAAVRRALKAAGQQCCGRGGNIEPVGAIVPQVMASLAEQERQL